MKPLLYTFRRCPYAIRARLAIGISGVDVESREVDLRNKPQAMLDCSPKGTVPVLQLADGRVIDESLDIMHWALGIHDPNGWINVDAEWAADAAALIEENDGSFKQLLDRYKYPGRDVNPHVSAGASARDAAGDFLRRLDARLAAHAFLMGERISLVDAAIFPFVRQFAHVDKAWFDQCYAGPLGRWLEKWLQSPLFLAAMRKDRGSTANL